MIAIALEARGLTLSWDGKTPVVRDLSFALAPGETVCLVGQSGCGKTTILHALAGLLAPLEGKVLLHGQDVSGQPGHVSYMLQKDLLLPHLSILDNVCLPLVLSAIPRQEAQSRATELLERFGLAGTEKLWPSQLSGGMRQRAAFLRTYLMGNNAVLLDEPFSALDAITRSDIRHWYANMAHELGLASVVITHDVDEAASIADKIYVLRGAPKAGEPTGIAGVVVPQRLDRGVTASSFELSEHFLHAKREVLELLA